MSFTIKAAEPINNRIILSMAGPQASGKTTSALRLATGIVKATGGKICFIDTENKRALQYAKTFKFNHIDFQPPFSPERYDECIQFAEKQGYGEGDVIIIDSMSHEHEGVGGVLEIQEAYMKKKNYDKRFNMQSWNHAKKGRKTLISHTLTRTPCHIILCFRAKHSLKEVNINGKTEYIRTGLERIGANEYSNEMNIAMIFQEGSMGNPDWSEKASRINEFGGQMPLTKLLRETTQITEETGRAIAEITSSKPQEENNDEQKIKSIARDVVQAIRKASDPTDLYMVMQDFSATIDQIKQTSESHYAFIIDQHDKMLSYLEGRV
jgi:energy-coupling factor transporter ATP-binding protein EcfA2